MNVIQRDAFQCNTYHRSSSKGFGPRLLVTLSLHAGLWLPEAKIDRHDTWIESGQAGSREASPAPRQSCIQD
jgi:hypothetical protein